MPSSNGVYTLPVGYLAVTGATIQASQHNPPLEDIATALTGRLSRDGTAAMTGALQLAVGTVGAPGAVFSTDLTTGLYKTASGIGVAVSGVKVAEFLAGGINGARLIGELIPYTCTAAPALTVLPFGQTLNRITYAALWAQAQIEIAAGNTFYNNGDGSTTFGIGDLRGRVPAGNDKMGGSAAGRLTTAATGFNADATVLGTASGSQSNSVILTHNHGITDPTHGHAQASSAAGGTPGILTQNVSGAYGFAGSVTASSGTGITINNAGSAAAHNIAQPTIITNYLLYAGA